VKNISKLLQLEKIGENVNQFHCWIKSPNVVPRQRWADVYLAKLFFLSTSNNIYVFEVVKKVVEAADDVESL